MKAYSKARFADRILACDDLEDYDEGAMLIFPCQVCNTQLSAEESQSGQLSVRCPTCLSTLRVPVAQRQAQLAGVGASAGAAAASGTALPPRPNFGLLAAGCARRRETLRI